MPEQYNSIKTIYHADDDEDDRLLFTDAVDELGLSAIVHQAEDGQKLLDMLFHNSAQLPEIIFLDINMPGRNGFECLAELRKGEGALRKVKVVMLSTSSTPENIARSFELGADLYAVKPSTYQGLKELLSEILETDWKWEPKSRNHNKVYSSLTWLL